jgi:hypothetical protein
METIYAAIGLFGAAALGGVFLLSLVLRERERPKAIIFLHGLLAVSGVIVLIVYSLNNPGPIGSIVIFLIAATGGLVMAYKEFTTKQVPKWLAIVHGLLAITGFIVLLVFAAKNKTQAYNQYRVYRAELNKVANQYPGLDNYQILPAGVFRLQDLL